jgi:diaminohydroxyphosphoribosylaminopyrimidine deaminase / 5-amino-6-(5-phosphoribosylamino)uracil reductase
LTEIRTCSNFGGVVATRTLLPVSTTPTVEADARHMRRAVELAAEVRATTSPNPWVGCVIVGADGRTAEGATRPPGGPHAEAVALAAARQAGVDVHGATAYVTLEPCSHHGRTPPCADALVGAGVGRVVVGITDPDPRVAGRGVDRLRAAGIEVTTGVEAGAIADQLAAYLVHRTTGRPLVLLKLAASLDGRTAAPDGTSRWITGEAARADAHGLRAESDAVLVGAGTVRADDPELTVRHVAGRDPLRVVLGSVPPDARVHPALERRGDLGAVLDELGGRDVLQVLVEGGATVAGAFHRAGLVDRYVVYLAPALFGGDDAPGLFSGAGAATMSDVWRGRITRVTPLGDDIRVDLQPREAP